MKTIMKATNNGIYDREFICDIRYLAEKFLKYYFGDYHAEYAYFRMSYEDPHSSEFKIVIDNCELSGDEWKNLLPFCYGKVSESSFEESLENYFKRGVKKIRARKKLLSAEDVAKECTWELILGAAKEYKKFEKYSMR